MVIFNYRIWEKQTVHIGIGNNGSNNYITFPIALSQLFTLDGSIDYGVGNRPFLTFENVSNTGFNLRGVAVCYCNLLTPVTRLL